MGRKSRAYRDIPIFALPLRHVTVNPRPSDRALMVHIHPEGSAVL
jgi:hypothetical protein